MRILTSLFVSVLVGCAAGPAFRIQSRPGETDPQIAWTAALGSIAAGAPAPTAAGGVLVPMRESLAAYSAAGKLQWEFQEGSEFRTPAVDAEGRALVIYKGGIALLDAAGKKLWSRNAAVVDALLDPAGGAYVLEEKSLWAGRVPSERRACQL